MTIDEIKELFEAKLEPIHSDIKELKEGQIQVVELLKVQERHDEQISHLRGDILNYKRGCEISILNCQDEVNKIKEKNDKKMWEIMKLIIASLMGGIITKIFI